KQNGRLVTNCFLCFFSQPTRVREQACIVEVYQKQLKKPARHHTRLFARCQPATTKNVKINAESHHVGVRKGRRTVFRHGSKEERAVAREERAGAAVWTFPTLHNSADC